MWCFDNIIAHFTFAYKLQAQWSSLRHIYTSHVPFVYNPLRYAACLQQHSLCNHTNFPPLEIRPSVQSPTFDCAQTRVRRRSKASVHGAFQFQHHPSGIHVSQVLDYGADMCWLSTTAQHMCVLSDTAVSLFCLRWSSSAMTDFMYRQVSVFRHMLSIMHPWLGRISLSFWPRKCLHRWMTIAVY